MGHLDSDRLLRDRMRDFVRLISDWLWETDGAGRLTYSSDRVIEVLGRPAPALLGMTFAELGTWPDGPPPRDRPFRDHRFEAPGLDGETRVLLISGLPTFDPDSGAHTGARGTATDITAAERAGRDRDRQIAFQKVLLDAIPLPVFLKDREGRLAGCNQALERALGVSRSRLVGRRADSALTHAGFRDSREWEESVLRRGGTRMRETTALFADGEQHHVVITASAHRSETGQVAGLIGVITDVTRRKEAEDALRSGIEELTASNRELQRFSGLAARDLQEPARAMAGAAERLAHHLDHTAPQALDAQARDILDDILRGARRMRGLVQDLAAYSRAGREGQAPETLAANALVQEALGHLAPTLRKTGALVTCEPLPRIEGRRRELVDTFRNLLDNALKYRVEGQRPEIRIRWTPQEGRPGWARFSVLDNGIGLEPGQATKIFTVFRRLHGPEDYQGSGVGLAVCRRVIEHHGGTIWVDSRPGEGCHFQFTLPLAREDETREDETRPAAGGATAASADGAMLGPSTPRTGTR